ncbi:hypothetical protein ACPV5O_09800 [Vibrio maritimus]|uniref:hypothetical protein n=1 Tax=Vibrio maritimus TaxID=990268 RepID=UPI00406827FB
MKKLFAVYLHSMMRLAEKSPVVTRLVRKSNTLLVKVLVKQYEKKGLPGWQSFWIPAFAEYGKYRAPYLVDKMNIDSHSPRSIGSYHDYEDPIFGVTGHWEVSATGEDIRVETACSACDDLQRLTNNRACRGDFCKHLVAAMENATGQAINEKYRVDIISLLTEDEQACRFVHRIERS